jgi:hypothetical protein
MKFLIALTLVGSASGCATIGPLFGCCADSFDQFCLGYTINADDEEPHSTGPQRLVEKNDVAMAY